MQIVIAGASGFIGKALKEFLETEGHQVNTLKHGGEGIGRWDPAKGLINLADLEGSDAIINLAGENIADGRWNEDKKRNIFQSRVQSTSLLADSIPKLQNPPSVFINASAIGYYGNDVEDPPATEESPPGPGFLGDVCRAWEAAAESISKTNTRLVIVRIGVVLSSKGGALEQMLPPFKMGLAGKLGTGQQVMSWIALEDLVRVFEFCLTNNTIRGPVNAVSPDPVTNLQFTKALGKVLRRPTWIPAPAFLLRLVMGEMADEMILSSTRVMPQKLLNAGFSFRLPELEPALRKIIS